MSDQLTKKDIQDAVGKSTGEILEVVQAFVGQVDERFNQVDYLFGRMEERFTKIDKRFELIDKRFDTLTNLIDGYAGKIDTYAQEMAFMDHKINRLEKYIQVLADKAGVDLDKIHV